MYDYRCDRCGITFEVRQSFSDNKLTVCPSAGGPAGCESPGEGPVKKVFSGVAISFKGDGFYKNDHGANARGRRKERETAKKASSDDSSSKGKSSTDNGASARSSGSSSDNAKASRASSSSSR